MRYTVWDVEMQHVFRESGLTRQQRSLLEGLLRSMEPGAQLSDHVTVANSAYLAVVRAQEGLAGNVHGQPVLSLTERLISTSLADVNAAEPAYVVGGASDLDAARNTLGEAQRELKKTTTKQEKIGWAERLEESAELIAAAVRGWVGALWQGQVLSPEVLATVVAEMAVSVSLAGRDGRALRGDLVALLAGGCPEPDALKAILWPHPQTYRVSMLVEGPQKLENIELLLPGAKQPAIRGIARGPRSMEVQSVQAILTSGEGGRRPATVVHLPVDAPDAYAAIRYGRRQLSEALDQYAAAARLVDFSIGPRSVVTDSSDARIQADPFAVSTKNAQPLTTHWPTALRPALRSAHLASRADAPMTATVLAWSALDSMNVTTGQLDKLAKACTLQTVRQQLISVFTTITSSTNACLEHARWQLSEADRVLVKKYRAVERTRGQLTDAGRKRNAELEVAADEARRHQEECEAHLARVEADLRPLYDLVRRDLLHAEFSAELSSLTARGLRINEWLDVLLPPLPTTSPEVRAIQAAIGALGVTAGGLAADVLDVWRARLASPQRFKEWLRSQQDHYHALLAWLYATRNLAIHTGRFTGPADTVTAEAACGLLDLILEFLGNWHQEEQALKLPGSDAMVIFAELACRKDELDTALASPSATCHPLQVETITAPTGSAWHRV